MAVTVTTQNTVQHNKERHTGFWLSTSYAHVKETALQPYNVKKKTSWNEEQVLPLNWKKVIKCTDGMLWFHMSCNNCKSSVTDSWQTGSENC